MTRRHAAARGMTLIELMVALLIGMILTLAVFGVMATFEGKRRTLNSNADLDQAGTLAMFQLDRWVRSAGTGFAQANAYAYGCVLYAAKSNSRILPVSGTLAAPFASVNPGSAGVFRLAPLLILPDQTTPGVSGKTSDALVLMSAGAGNGNAPTAFSAAAASTLLTLINTVPFSASDLVLLADKQPTSAGVVSPCLLTQAGSGVSGGATTTMALGGNWYQSTIDTRSVTDYKDPTSAVAIDLGNPSTGLEPSFQLVGVGDHNTLYSYDLLKVADTPLQARAQGVFEMHALYGVDTNSDGLVDLWVSPSTSPYTVAELSAGTSTAATLLKNIRAVRVGLILRTSQPEKDVVNTGTSLTLFSDLGGTLTYTRALSSDEQHYRYRTIEATIPLRNNFL